MSYGEDLLKLRQRIADAVVKNVVNKDGKDFVEATLIQIMNDAERNRQNCIAQAESLKKQAAMSEGQASAFASISSIVYNVINGFILAADRAEEEEERLRIEAAGKEDTTIIYNDSDSQEVKIKEDAKKKRHK